MKRWTTFAALVFALHFAWEMMQAKWFESMQGLPLSRATLTCARASFGDLVITALAFTLAALVGGGAKWPTSRRVLVAAAVFIATGIAITAGYERFALGRGMWRYDDTMPILFGIGALPLLQWLLLPLIEVMLFRLIDKRASGGPAAVVACIG
ncbi:MAG TPA: hypothetical protein VHL58_04340 [Thermoanaerobaculia bacterium]|nr:hypothetical protein [Thermoanaerobaculia bacterium]